MNLFGRFALMRRWVDDKVATIPDLENGVDHLHAGEWETNCISRALCDAIIQAVASEGTT